jgi:branched-chain amino acid transport system substrate-binding protein
MSLLVRAIGILVASLMAAGTAQAADPVKIGLFVPLTGFVAQTGKDIRDVVSLVVKEKNASGGVLGRQIELVVADDGGRPEEAVNIARRFATKDQVLIAIGSATSPVSLAASEVFGEEEVPQIVVTATAQKITAQGNPWVFRSATPDTKLVGDLTDFIKQRMPQLKRFAILYVNDDFGKGGVDKFKAAVQGTGVEIVTEERFASGDLDFTGQLKRIRDAHPDALLEWSRYSEGALVARQMKQIGMVLPHFGSDSFSVPEFIELAADAANGLIYPSPFSAAVGENRPEAQGVIAHLKPNLARPLNYQHIQAYDAINVAIAAIERANKADRTAVRDALRKTDYMSARGHFTFDAKGDPTFPTMIVRIVDQKETDARQ